MVKRFSVAELEDLVHGESLVFGLVLVQQAENQAEEVDAAGQDNAARGRVTHLVLVLVEHRRDDRVIEEAGRDDEPPPLLSDVDTHRPCRNGPAPVGLARRRAALVPPMADTSPPSHHLLKLHHPSSLRLGME